MQFPKHELAGNAQYWLGEAVYGQQKYDLAITEFEKVLKNYSKSIKVPAALLKIGYAQFELGETKTATKTLNNNRFFITLSDLPRHKMHSTKINTQRNTLRYSTRHTLTVLPAIGLYHR